MKRSQYIGRGNLWDCQIATAGKQRSYVARVLGYYVDTWYLLCYLICDKNTGVCVWMVY